MGVLTAPYSNCPLSRTLRPPSVPSWPYTHWYAPLSAHTSVPRLSVRQMWHDESVKNLAGDLELKAGVERITAAIALPKVKEAAASVLALLK